MFLASLVAGLALLVGPAAATPATGVTLLLRENYDYSTIDWTASAPIAESGLWDKGRLTFHGGNGNPNWAGMIKTTLTSSGGSFDMEFQGRGNGTTGAFSGTLDHLPRYGRLRWHPWHGHLVRGRPFAARDRRLPM